MPWRCPACGEQIRHSEVEDMPKVRAYYRCHICRLELIVDPDTRKFTVAAADTAANQPPKRESN